MFNGGALKLAQVLFIFFTYIAPIFADLESSKDIHDGIILAATEIQKGCSAHKKYNNARNYLSLLIILKSCPRSDEFPLDSTARKICRFIEVTDIEKMRALCAREQVGKNYSTKQLIPYEQKYNKTHRCEADGSFCYEAFLMDFSVKNLPKFKQCLDDKKFYYQNLCDLFDKKEPIISY